MKGKGRDKTEDSLGITKAYDAEVGIWMIGLLGKPIKAIYSNKWQYSLNNADNLIYLGI